ncbi:MAG: hypothetical protein K0Q87_92 [Neobacillus sp.]|jgi:hypothetical protein|nr:hypothetical protein [Neobacillus sp.]
MIMIIVLGAGAAGYLFGRVAGYEAYEKIEKGVQNGI